MMTATNSVTLIGNLGADPHSFGRVVTARIAVDTVRKVGDEWRTRVDWFSLVAFGAAAEHLLAFTKGDRIQIDGRLQTNVWTDAESGNERERVEIVVLTSTAAPLRAAAVGAETSG
ncbi:MAG: single-stranded DNA-binding protein [Blastochloris sp.]|nr:single-stranded DNA-binding protein [Blastochloris sp.]